MIHRTGLRGLGRSYIDGLLHALAEGSADYICQMDADLSHNPDYLPDLVAAAATHDLVIGSRYLYGVSVVNWPLHRIFLSAFANRYIRLVTNLSASDCTSGFRCWRREALARLPIGAMVSDGYAFLVEMLYDAKKRGLPHRRGADHLRRAAAGTVETVVRRPDRIAADALAPRVSRTAELTCAHRVVMVTTSYPRFPGDSVGTFMEPIAKGLAARGHEIHVVAPWHPSIHATRVEDGVYFHFFKYAPVPALNVFGYAQGMHADVRCAPRAWAAAPLAIAAGMVKAMRVAQKRGATIMHGHWVVPGGAIAAVRAAAAAAGRQPARVGRLRRRARRHGALGGRPRVSSCRRGHCVQRGSRAARHRAGSGLRAHRGHSLRRGHGKVRTRCRSARRAPRLDSPCLRTRR